jgi:hypothetical protein
VATLWEIAGLLLLLGIVVDLFLTVFQPSLRGPLSTRANRLVWGSFRRIARHGRSRVLTFGGPVAIVVDVTLWLAGLIVAFGLIYRPHLHGFAFASDVRFGDRGVVEALYASGVVALTIGFGDIVASTDAMRLMTVLEGAAGAGLLSAAITYVLSVYPIVTDQRATALRFSDLGMQDVEGVAGLLCARGLAPVEAVHAALIRNHQHLRRFPVLYYFQPRDESESSYALLRAAAITCAVLLWGTDEEAVGGARRYAKAIQATLDRMVDDYIAGYVQGLSNRGEPLTRAQARCRLESLRAATAYARTDAADELADWAGRIEHFLGGLAAAHLLDPRPLFSPSPRRLSPGSAVRSTAGAAS